MCDLLVTDLYLHRERGDFVRSGNEVILGSLFKFGQCGTYGDLDTFGCRFVDTHVVHAAHEVDDVTVEVVAGSLDGLVSHDATEGYNGDLGCTATYIHHHASARSLYVHAYTDSRRHRFVEHVDLTSAGVLATVAYGTDLHLGTTRRNTNHHSNGGCEEAVLLRYHLDKSADHHFARLEVGNNAFLERSYGADLLAAAANHLLRLSSDSQTLVVSN